MQNFRFAILIKMMQPTVKKFIVTYIYSRTFIQSHRLLGYMTSEGLMLNISSGFSLRAAS